MTGTLAAAHVGSAKRAQAWRLTRLVLILTGVHYLLRWVLIFGAMFTLGDIDDSQSQIQLGMAKGLIASARVLSHPMDRFATIGGPPLVAHLLMVANGVLWALAGAAAATMVSVAIDARRKEGRG